MALTIGQKCGRVLRFLRGVRRPRVFGALAAHGFGKADLEEGWALLRGSSEVKLDVPPIAIAKPGIYDQLDVWENQWFPISQAALSRHYPEVAERVFLNLRQTSGLEVSVSVGAFTKRVRGLETGNKTDKAARELLAKRGLTKSVLQEAEDLLQSLERVPDVPLPVEPNREDVAAAEAAMWSWYLEWSAIARHAVHDRRLLRSLGFLTASGADVSNSEPTDDDLVDVEAAEPIAAE